MKKILLFAMATLLLIMARSQDVYYEDVVYLKDGSVIRGVIVEQVPNKMLKIQTENRNIFVYEFDRIVKITREAVPRETIIQEKGELPTEKKLSSGEGFESSMSFGFGGLLQWGSPAFITEVVAGYRFIPQFFLGGGTGLEFYDERSMLPIFASIRTDFIKARVTPFFSINSGYAFGWVNYDEGSDWGGFFVEPSMGVRFNFTSSFGLNLSTSVKFQKGREHDYYYDHVYPPGTIIDYTYTETFRLFLFKVGFSF